MNFDAVKALVGQGKLSLRLNVDLLTLVEDHYEEDLPKNNLKKTVIDHYMEPRNTEPSNSQQL